MCQVANTAVSTVQPNPTRTTIGLGENITMTFVPQSQDPTWSLPSDEGGDVVPMTGTPVTYEAQLSPGSQVVRATVHGVNIDTTFNVIAPTSCDYTWQSDHLPGNPGPPNDFMQAASYFWSLYIRVCFAWTPMHENIPVQTFTCPSGETDTVDTFLGNTVYLAQDNTNHDFIESGEEDTSVLLQNGQYVSLTETISVPDEYENDDDKWVPWITGQHMDVYNASLTSCVGADYGDGSRYGSLMGPFKLLPN